MSEKSISERPGNSAWQAERNRTAGRLSLFIKGDGDMYVLNQNFRSSREKDCQNDKGVLASSPHETINHRFIEKAIR